MVAALVGVGGKSPVIAEEECADSDVGEELETRSQCSVRTDITAESGDESEHEHDADDALCACASLGEVGELAGNVW